MKSWIHTHLHVPLWTPWCIDLSQVVHRGWGNLSVQRDWQDHSDSGASLLLSQRYLSHGSLSGVKLSSKFSTANHRELTESARGREGWWSLKSLRVLESRKCLNNYTDTGSPKLSEGAVGWWWVRWGWNGWCGWRVFRLRTKISCSSMLPNWHSTKPKGWRVNIYCNKHFDILENTLVVVSDRYLFPLCAPDWDTEGPGCV